MTDTIEKVDGMELFQEAKESCEFRNHVMGEWLTDSKTVSHSNCLLCGKQVVVNEKPLPNDIEISGEAVALNCIKHRYPIKFCIDEGIEFMECEALHYDFQITKEENGYSVKVFDSSIIDSDEAHVGTELFETIEKVIAFIDKG